jgi:hypothetical protein
MRSRVFSFPAPASWVVEVVRAVVVSAIVGGVFLVAAPVVAGAAVPAWQISDQAAPNSVAAGGSALLRLEVVNAGDAVSDGSPITVVDRLPQGMTATAVRETDGVHDWECEGVGTSTVTCINAPGGFFLVIQPTFYNGWGLVAHGGGGEGVPLSGNPPTPIEISVSIAGSASGVLTDDATVAGGGAAVSASDHSTITVSPSPTPFGVEGVRVYSNNADGSPDTQAGSHPYSATAVVKFNLTPEGPPTYDRGAGALRGVHVELPSGLVGNPLAYPRCPQQQFEERGEAIGSPECPLDTQVGAVSVDVLEGGGDHAEAPLFSVVPSHGEVARFGAAVGSVASAYFNVSVGPGPAHDLSLDIHNIGNEVLAGYAYVTFWGVPADPSHDFQRGHIGGGATAGPPQSTDAPVKPFLTLPVQCGGRQAFSLSAEAWAGPETTGPLSVGPVDFFSSDARGNPTILGGCGNLDFSPTLEATPTSTLADSPTGVSVDVRSPQREHEENPGGLAEADLKNAVVSLPAGVTINPSGANGLGACSEAQIDLNGAGPAQCPPASKIGSLEVEAPALEHPLPGAIYLARQDENPFHSLFAGYIVIEDPVSGVRVKLAAELKTDPLTGQITGVVHGSPQFPVSSIKLRFFNELATPQACGSYTTTSDLTPWSTPETLDATPSSTFQVTGAANGAGCPGGVLGFAPAFSAGTVSNQAGAYSAFSVSFSRSDGEQHLAGVSVKMPPGLLGKLAGIPLCGEPQAGLGQCPAASLIGEVGAAVGVGSEPFVLHGGRVYLTGPYNGGPFGLSIVVPAVAGPFNLGNVVERASVRVDPNTAQVSVVSDGLPQMVNSIEGLRSGIPVDLRSVTISIGRPGFLFNPTSCEPLSVTGTLTGAQGTTVPVSSRFQAAGCQSLKFAPSFKVSTSGKTSRSKGASLDAKVIYPAVPLAANQAAGEANIASVKVDLPKQLPSRLTTLQKACTAAQFNANPAGCPSASVIGHATAITQVLPVPLTGPAIFVSHGGEAFPSLIIVLQGYGVTVDLVATTFISKAGITSSTFKALPDVPFKTFDLNLPEGKYSALAANGNLCTSKLAMPTAFVGQNGAVIHESTKIAVTGCPKVKALTRAQKLTRALKACHKKAKGKQAACVKTAHKRYVVNTNAKGKKHAGGKRHG